MPSRETSGNWRQRHRSQLSRKTANAGRKARRGGRNGSRDDDAASILKKNKTEKTKARTSSSINEKNRKTEICRNWEKGICIFGGGCAFAHGHDEIKRKTLRDLEQDGRIPDASKHHAFPCMSWVATGACSYGPGCRFIHDSRVQGPAKALPRTSCRTKSGNCNGSTASPVRASSLLGCASDTNGSRFFFPDIPKDPDSIELPPDEVRYDIINAGQKFSTAYRLWYSFVSVCVGLSSASTGDLNEIKTSAETSKSNGRGDPALCPDLSASAPTDAIPSVTTTAVTHRSAAAATGSPGPTAAGGSAAYGCDAVDTVDAHGAVVDLATSFLSAVYGSPEPRDKDGRCSSSSSSVIEQDHSKRGVARRCEGDNTDHSDGTGNVGDDTLKPLPVFEGLRIGASARLSTPPTGRLALASLHEIDHRLPPGWTSTTSCSRLNCSRATPVALGPTKAALEVDTRHDDDYNDDDGAGGDNDDAYASRSWSSCSRSSSSDLSSPSSDSYVSCRLLASPSCSWRSAVQSPIAGRDTPRPSSSDSWHDALAAPLRGGFEGTVSSHADAESRSSSASVSVEERGCRGDGSDPFHHLVELGLPSPSKAAERFFRPFGGGAASRLPVFASLYSDATDIPVSGGGNTRGYGSVLDLRLSGGRCGGGASVGASGSSVKEMRSKDSASCDHIAGFFDNNGADGSIRSFGGVPDSPIAAKPVERASNFRFPMVHQLCRP